MNKKVMLVALVSLIAVSSLVTASTFYYSETCPHCQAVLDSGLLSRLPCLNMCNVKSKECQKYSGVPVLEHNRNVYKGSNNVISHLRNLPYYSKMPTEDDSLVGEQKVGNIVYEVYESPDGNKFLGRDIKSIE